MASVSLPVRFYGGVLGTTQEQIFTVQSGETVVVTSLIISNLTDVAQSATVQMANVDFIKNIDLAPRQVTVFDFKQVMNAGESIRVQAGNAASVSLFLSGVKVTEI